MSDTYGSGLTFGTPDGGGPAFGAQSAAPSPPMDLSPQSAPDAAPATPQPTFGSSLSRMLPGAHYDQPDPQSSALDQSAALLEQRVKRANSVATNPIAEFFAPEQVQAARQFVPQATEMLQKIQTQKAAIQAGRVQAQTLGLAPGEVPDQATQADRVEVATANALKGNLKTFQGLAVVDPQRAAAIQDQVHEVVAGHLDKAQFAFDSLAAMQNEGQYRAKVNQLRQDGTLSDLESLGLKLPATFEAFGASKGAESKALREARIAVQNLGARIEERSGGAPMEKKEAETYKGRLTTELGDELNNITWSRINGKRVAGVNGMADIRDLGKKFNFISPDQRKAFHEDAKAAVPEKEIEKARSFERIGTLATKDANGKFIPAEGLQSGKDRIYINTNPNVMQGMAEGFAAELRGGQGGATSGLLNIESNKRGAVQALFDKLKAAYGGGVNSLTGDQVKPYLTQITQKQQREVLDALREYNAKSINDRVASLAQRVGALGGDASALGLGKGEFKGVEDAIEAGRQSTIARFTPRARATSGGDGGIYLDNPPPMLITQPDNPNAAHPPVPPPVTPPLPRGDGVQQPAPPSQPPALQPGGAGSPPGGGGGDNQPVPVAGQQFAMALPQGASPNYAQATQRIESGNDRDPWTATTKGSSASGAFQFIDSTWKENRPAGAPDRAKDATPAQQAEAFATLTAKNASALKATGVPVNDTSLYVAHNLGVGGAAELLQSDPAMEARKVVGEKAARNNPMFFRGNPTVATVLQRYASAVAGVANDGSEPPTNKPEGRTIADVGGRAAVGAIPGGAAATLIWDRLSPSQKQAVKDAAVENAPAIGSVAGAVGGGAVGGPAGGIAGGAAGGGAGQALKSYLKNEPQNPQEIAKQTALGGVLGVFPVGRPIIGAAARALGAGAVEAADSVAKGEGVDALEAGAKGVGYALGGEALGRFVQMGGAGAYKALSRYTTSAQQELSASAGKLAEARAVLDKEQPKLPGDAGPNPKYEAAKKAEEDATQAIKDHGQNPDDMVHAYEQAKSGVSAGEAAVLRGASAEKRNVSEGYNQLRSDIRDTGVGTPKPNQPIPDGPLAQLRTDTNMTGKVPELFRPEAEHAERIIRAPAKDWGEKWQQLQNAGTELIEKRMAFLAAGDKPSAKAMDNLFEGVRNQQKAAAQYVFGKEGGEKVIARLENLDQRYAKIMNATAGMDYGKMRNVIAAGNTPERRELEKNFREFAKDDPSAIRAFNAMKAGAKGRLTEEAKLMVPIITAESLAHLGGVPTLGAISLLVGGHRLYKVMQEYANAKVLGKAVMFKDFLNTEIQKSRPPVAGSIGARSAVQGDNLPDKAGGAVMYALP